MHLGAAGVRRKPKKTADFHRKALETTKGFFFEARIFSRKMHRKIPRNVWAFILWVNKIPKIPAKFPTKILKKKKQEIFTDELLQARREKSFTESRLSHVASSLEFLPLFYRALGLLGAHRILSAVFQAYFWRSPCCSWASSSAMHVLLLQPSLGKQCRMGISEMRVTRSRTLPSAPLRSLDLKIASFLPARC